MRVIIAICAGLIDLSIISAQAATSAPSGGISGAAGIGAIAFRRCTGIYLAKTWRTRFVC